MILPMSRSKNLQSLLLAPLVVLPMFMACGSGSSKPAASADEADQTTESALSDDTSGDKADAEKADDSDAAKPEETKGDEKAAAGDEDDAASAPPKDDSRTTAACDKVITDNRKAFKKCYEDVRKTKPDLKGSITLVIDIDSKGKVTKAAIDEDSTIKEPKIDECMTAFAKTLTFPASTKGLEKNFTHEFIYNMGVKQ
jgi:hypothetical protein